MNPVWPVSGSAREWAELGLRLAVRSGNILDSVYSETHFHWRKESEWPRPDRGSERQTPRNSRVPIAGGLSSGHRPLGRIGGRRMASSAARVRRFAPETSVWLRGNRRGSRAVHLQRPSPEPLRIHGGRRPSIVTLCCEPSSQAEFLLAKMCSAALTPGWMTPSGWRPFAEPPFRSSPGVRRGRSVR
jgi:hypothetical protein